MFESLKKKFSGTVGKISDKFSVEEETEENAPVEKNPEEVKKEEPEETFEKLEEIQKPAEEKETEGVRGKLSGIFSREKGRKI